MRMDCFRSAIIGFYPRLSAFSAVILLTVGIGSAQSGRVKPTETPTPRTITGPSVRNLPPQAVVVPKATPTVKPTPKDESDDVIKVDSVLVPIPVSVLDV